MRLETILCVDDEEICTLYYELFSQINKNFYITSAATFQEAAELVKRKAFRLYIIEPYRLGTEGFELCRIIRKKDSRAPIIIYTSMSREIDRRRALAAGADAYFIKADDFDAFIKTVEYFLRRQYKNEKNDPLLFPIPNSIFKLQTND